MADEQRQHIFTLTMQDIVDGIVTGDIFNLSTTKVVFRVQRLASRRSVPKCSWRSALSATRRKSKTDY